MPNIPFCYFNPGKKEQPQMELELKLSNIGRKISYQVVAQNQGAEGKVDIRLIFPAGLKDKNRACPLQWKNQKFVAGESKTFTYREFEAATPGHFEVICRVEQNQTVMAEVKKQITIDNYGLKMRVLERNFVFSKDEDFGWFDLIDLDTAFLTNQSQYNTKNCLGYGSLTIKVQPRRIVFTALPEFRE